jgi:hypothetical protein
MAELFASKKSGAITAFYLRAAALVFIDRAMASNPTTAKA